MNQTIIAADNLKATQLYQKVMSTKQRMEKRGVDAEEAAEIAWEERKYILKCFLQHNKDEVAEWIFPEDEEDA